MSGVGQRFVDVGYKDIKPLILADRKRMAEYIASLFPKTAEFVFICNRDHLEKTDLAKVLKKISANAKIIEIAPHKKGPVFAVSQAFHSIGDSNEVIVQHIDTYKYWNFHDFLSHTRKRKADAAITANLGFHPHMLTGVNYALSSAKRQWMESMAEKTPLKNIHADYVSDGTYYFKSGALVKKYFSLLMEQDVQVDGEYYVSLVYPLLLKDNYKVSIYEVQHVASLGVPADVETFAAWSKYFRIAAQKKKSNLKMRRGSVNLIPLAGNGSRFADEGYKKPKPLIDVAGKPMIVQAASYLPTAEETIFVCLGEHLQKYPLKKAIKKSCPNARIVALDSVTQGQACTCEIGLAGVSNESELHISASDNLIVFNKSEYRKLLNDKKIDAIVWGANHIPMSLVKPDMYGWIKKDEDNNISGISVKKPISKNPFEDFIITATFYFRKVEFFRKALISLYNKNRRIKGEFYVDSMIDELVMMGYRVKLFPVDHFISWGTPNELKSYEYWQGFFHKEIDHPYDLRKDHLLDMTKLDDLTRKTSRFKQRHC